MTTESVPLAYDPSATVVVATNSVLYPNQFKSIYAREASVNYIEFAKYQDLRKKVESLIEYLTDNYETLEVSADEIAQIFGRTLEKEVSVTVVVEFNLNMTLPIGTSLEEALDETSFSVEGFDTEIEVDDHRIVRFLER